MEDLEVARKRWIEEEPIYEEFAKYLKAELEILVKDPNVKISFRTKEIDSLIKKLIRKPEKTYEELSDKAGVRVIVKFTDEVDVYGRVIEERFPDCRTDDKRKPLIENEKIGYQGIHYDVTLSRADSEYSRFAGIQAEIQVRTLAQHLWSDMSHELGYKSELPISEVNSRRLLRLNALVELADDEFLNVRNEIREMPEFNAVRVLEVLQGEFHKFAGVDYDKELSKSTINQLNDLYGEGGFLLEAEHFKRFCEENGKVISHIFDENRELPIRPVFLFQPESLMIFQLLEKDKFKLREKWEEIYPLKELERLAIVWGKPYA